MKTETVENSQIKPGWVTGRYGAEQRHLACLQRLRREIERLETNGDMPVKAADVVLAMVEDEIKRLFNEMESMP